MNFADITDFSKYNFTKDGKVSLKSTGRESPPMINKHGYIYFNMTTDDERVISFRQHRIVCALNHGLPENHASLTVNHKNGIKIDNSPDNLEWMTVAENRIHASKNKLDKKRTCQYLDLLTNEVVSFESILDCAVHLKISKDDVMYRSIRPVEKAHLSFKMFRIPASDDPWPIPPNMETLVCLRFFPTGVILRDLTKPEAIRTFDNHTDAVEFLGIALSTLSFNFDRYKHPVFSNWQIKPFLDKSDWVDPDSIQQMKDSTTCLQKVYVKHSDGKEITYETAKAAANGNNIKPTALNYRLNINSDKQWSDGNIYKRVQ